jgi:hypothetical protein
MAQQAGQAVVPGRLSLNMCLWEKAMATEPEPCTCGNGTELSTVSVGEAHVGLVQLSRHVLLPAKHPLWCKSGSNRDIQRFTEIIHDPLLFSVAQGIF